MAGIGHLLVALGLAGRFLPFRWEQSQFTHYPEQALRAAGVAAACATAPPCPTGDFSGAYPGSASALPLCVGSNGCGPQNWQARDSSVPYKNFQPKAPSEDEGTEGAEEWEL